MFQPLDAQMSVTHHPKKTEHMKRDKEEKKSLKIKEILEEVENIIIHTSLRKRDFFVQTYSKEGWPPQVILVQNPHRKKVFIAMH
jgi:hypothetical protein